MDRNNKYDALANTIKIEDITPDEINQVILHQLKQNDYSLQRMQTCNFSRRKVLNMAGYVPGDLEDAGWLGYYIGQNTSLQELDLTTFIKDTNFYRADPKEVNKKNWV